MLLSGQKLKKKLNRFCAKEYDPMEKREHKAMYTIHEDVYLTGKELA